jgi:hypothetical protein
VVPPDENPAAPAGLSLADHRLDRRNSCVHNAPVGRSPLDRKGRHSNLDFASMLRQALKGVQNAARA